jgi:hypothetical protein
MYNQVFSAVVVSAYLYRQAMAPVDETKGEVKPMSWLEFISDNDRPLHDLWQWAVNAREIRQRFDTPVEGDEYWDKTWLMNLVAYVKDDITNHTAMGNVIMKRFAKVHLEGLEEFRQVPTTVKAMLHAAQARRNVAPGTFAVTPEETEWQWERVTICNKAIVCLNQMKANLLGEEERQAFKKERALRSGNDPMPDLRMRASHGLTLQRGPDGFRAVLGLLKPFYEDEKRRHWMKTSDDGCWENDLGEKWDEDDHNGMRPYDECGDTESEEEELAECDGGALVPEKHRVLGMKAPAPGGS